MCCGTFHLYINSDLKNKKITLYERDKGAWGRRYDWGYDTGLITWHVHVWIDKKSMWVLKAEV